MKEKLHPTKRTVDDCFKIITEGLKEQKPLSFTSIKKSSKEPINNKLITTALNLLAEEQIIEKKLINGKIRYTFSDANLASYLNTLLNLNLKNFQPQLESEVSNLPSRLTKTSIEKILLILLLQSYIQYFVKNELAIITNTTPTYNLILSLIHKRITDILSIYVREEPIKSIENLIAKLEINESKDSDVSIDYETKDITIPIPMNIRSLNSGKSLSKAQKEMIKKMASNENLKNT